MRVLFTTVPMHGHFFPMVPLAHAFRAAGHEVLVGTPASLTAAVTEAGLPAATTEPALSFAQIMTVDRHGNPVPRATTMEGRFEAAGRAWGRLARRTLPATRRLVDRWQPDLVVAEPSEHAGPLAAAARGIPWAEHAWGITTTPQTRPFTVDEMADELADLRRDTLPDPDLTLQVSPPSLGGPDGLTGQPIRYVPYNGSGVLPDWALEERDRPRICLTFGSVIPYFTYRDFVAMLREIAAALPALDAEVIVGVEDAFADRLDALPDRVRSVGWQPLGLVLPTCDLLVHHGGSGSMLTALAAGVPQLVLPQSADQFLNASSLAGVGAGRMLMPDGAGIDAVISECQQLLSDVGYAEKARALGIEMATMPAPAEVVGVLAALAG